MSRKPTPESQSKYNGPTAERLEAAALVSPIVRSINWKTLQRKVKVFNRETGDVVAESKYGEAVKGLVNAHALEIDVGEGVRPKELHCDCGSFFSIPKSGRIPTRCDECRNPTPPVANDRRRYGPRAQLVVRVPNEIFDKIEEYRKSLASLNVSPPSRSDVLASLLELGLHEALRRR